LPAPATAGQIAQACTASDRGAGDRRLCGCIQAVADQLLTRRDQRLAASFFADPHRAQEIRTSDNSGDARFWKRYTRFGEYAARTCR
jgi:hypothetical protein